MTSLVWPILLKEVYSWMTSELEQIILEKGGAQV